MAKITKGGPGLELRRFFSLIVLLSTVALSLLSLSEGNKAVAASNWAVKSIDTQIISKCWNNVSQSSIDQQVSMLKNLGVNYIAIGTPYDRPEEMKKWADSVHNAGLKVWFRSHWMNWEGDEGQAKNMSPDAYINQTHQFILDHPDFFRAGDSFTMNVEAENAGVGQGQPFADWNAYRSFLVREIDMANDAFNQIGLGGVIATNWLSMNGWIVENALDQATVEKMGIITVDHYSPQGYGSNIVSVSRLAADMSSDLDRFYARWGVPIMIGEWGYNINGEVSDDLQRQAVQAVYNVFAQKPYIYGVSYWDHMGNQTRIINDSGGTPTTFRPAADVIKSFYAASTTPVTDPAPSPVSSNLIANFEQGLDGFESGALIAGSNSAQAIRFTNPKNGSDGAKKDISRISMSGQSFLEFDINLNGNTLLSGDASAVYLEQGGWKYVSLTKYAENSKSGWQHIKIPLNDFQLTFANAAYLGFRFWNHKLGSYDIDNIMFTTGLTATPITVPASLPVATFEVDKDGFNNGQIVSGYQSIGALRLINPVNNSIGSEKDFSGAKVGNYSSLLLDINLNGSNLLQGDASAFYFEQGGWKWVSLSKYVKNGYSGWQHLTIPISDFQGLNKNQGIARIGLRFWNNNSGIYDIDNVVFQ